MWRRFKIFSVVLAWFLATGSHWEMMQTIAWAKMIVQDARTMTLGAAVVETFSGENPCSMCKIVEGAKRQEKNSETNLPEEGAKAKIFLFCYDKPAKVASINGASEWVAMPATALDAPRVAPPTPPPRSCYV